MNAKGCSTLPFGIFFSFKRLRTSSFQILSVFCPPLITEIDTETTRYTRQI